MDVKTNIALLDKQVIFRESLSYLLEKNTRFAVNISVSTPQELFGALKKQKVQLLILNIDLHSDQELETLKVLRKRYKELKILILNDSFNPFYVNEYLRLGVNSFITKGCLVAELISSIDKIFEQEIFLIEKMANGLLAFNATASKKYYGTLLSEREKEITHLLCSGKSDKEVALLLHISHHTVHKHRERVYKKTNSHNLADLMNFALKSNLLNQNS